MQVPATPLWVGMTAAMVSEAFSHTIVAPIERIKLVQRLRCGWGEDISMASLFKGHSAKLCCIGVHNLVKAHVSYLLTRYTNLSVTSNHFLSYLSGKLVSYPFVVLQVRMALPSAPGNEGVFQVAQHIVKQEGWSALFCGIGPFLSASLVYYGGYRWMYAAFPSSIPSSRPSATFNSIVKRSFIAIIAALTIYPIVTLSLEMAARNVSAGTAMQTVCQRGLNGSLYAGAGFLLLHTPLLTSLGHVCTQVVIPRLSIIRLNSNWV
ncbi:hypothetical protein QOT17_008368 [Balamuthia mandrillaris]